MATLRLTVDGDRELRRLMRTISPKQNPDLYSRAMLRSGEVVLDQIQKHIRGPRPKRLGVVSGRLANSMRITRKKLPELIRLGTKLRWAGKYDFGPQEIRRPFLMPAADKSGPRVLAVYTKTLADEIRRV